MNNRHKVFVSYHHANDPDYKNRSKDRESHEVITITESYEHEGNILNGPIIRDILNKASLYGLDSQQKWLSVREFQDKIEEFHVRNGGKPSQLKDFPTNLRDILKEMEAQRKAEADRSGWPHYWKLVPLTT